MTTPGVDAILAKLRELAVDPRNEVELPPPITAGAMTWLEERFQTKLQRPLPADLATVLRACDGAQIGKAVLLGGSGARGLVDHNLELRVPPGKWLPQQIVFGTVGAGRTAASYVVDVDTGEGHISDLLQPRWIKTFPSFAALLFHILRDQLGVRARGL